jgi:hypothetical protein
MIREGMPLMTVAKLAGDSVTIVTTYYAHVINRADGRDQMLSILNRGTDRGTVHLADHRPAIGLQASEN